MKRVAKVTVIHVGVIRRLVYAVTSVVPYASPGTATDIILRKESELFQIAQAFNVVLNNFEICFNFTQSLHLSLYLKL